MAPKWLPEPNAQAVRGVTLIYIVISSGCPLFLVPQLGQIPIITIIKTPNSLQLPLPTEQSFYSEEKRAK